MRVDPGVWILLETELHSHVDCEIVHFPAGVVVAVRKTPYGVDAYDPEYILDADTGFDIRFRYGCHACREIQYGSAIHTSVVSVGEASP